MNRYNQFFLWFHELPKAHRIRLIFLTSLIFIITIGTFYWALKPNYAVLFQNLEPEDAQQIIKKLEEQNTPYQLQKNGQTIRVPKISVDRTRMEIMTTHLNLAGTVGYELFDKNSFGLTDFTQKINLQRALQGELERTINQLEEVHHARLHLAVAQQSAFSREQPRPKASLTLSLKRPLTPTQIQGIQQLIAASVPNLSISKVVILDQQGNVLSFTDPIEHQHHSFKQNFERELRNKVRHLLSGIFGRDSVRVQINAEFNYDVLEHEEIQPQALGKLVHLKESKNTVHAAKNKSPEKEEHHFEKNFQYGNERKLFKQAPGRLQRLTVSALIPEGTSPSMVRQIRGLIETAVGYDAKRGDSINIEALLHRKMSPAAPAVSLSKNNPKLQIPPLPALTIWSTHLVEFLILMMLILGCGGCAIVFFRRIRYRRQLLLEISQWLEHQDVKS